MTLPQSVPTLARHVTLYTMRLLPFTRRDSCRCARLNFCSAARYSLGFGILVPSESVAKLSSPISTLTALSVDDKGSIHTPQAMWVYQPSAFRTYGVWFRCALHRPVTHDPTEVNCTHFSARFPGNQDACTRAARRSSVRSRPAGNRATVAPAG